VEKTSRNVIRLTMTLDLTRPAQRFGEEHVV
jgi:hypothetical protein